MNGRVRLLPYFSEARCSDVLARSTGLRRLLSRSASYTRDLHVAYAGEGTGHVG